MHVNGKQIVMDDDRPPKAMNTLEERLRSRCEWGLHCRIRPPDIETRMAILRAKAKASLSWSECRHRADRSSGAKQIRELEGALMRFGQFAVGPGRHSRSRQLRSR